MADSIVKIDLRLLAIHDSINKLLFDSGETLMNNAESVCP
jgi:hypothetical protein